ncbi:MULTISPECIES: DUF86 domain-containing protein [unclassified Methanoregula]|uniref:HepT-like ribonuclease domain-containing protein n=1 Tax=unclassified Methanoregula TaxID=2649730 RepID=UPI0009CAD410|nr:MAG: hypothetical protein A4E33_02291 [Methanoregula sp. PtaB.Bin085]OPY31641.1 MAG: hypothetical protein A4E34_02834 [Methanoregula sp. PtaU1.Bin006]
MKPEDPAYLHHILDAINHIEDFSRTITSASDLRDRPLERAGIERMLTIIGEAAKNVSSSLRKEYPDIPWKATAGMRDKIMHHYFGVDYEAVFETIRNDLPVLKTGVVAILSGESHKQGKKKNAQRKTG